MAHIGEIHYRYSIEPVWILGAYRLYLNYLQTLIRTSPEIHDTHRGALERSVTKLLFRDMGLMLEGYWDSSFKTLEQEKEKVTALQEQITSLLANIPQLLWSVDVLNNRPLYVSPSTREICQMDIEIPIPCPGWTVYTTIPRWIPTPSSACNSPPNCARRSRAENSPCTSSPK